jgi:hypothetical protein
VTVTEGAWSTTAEGNARKAEVNGKNNDNFEIFEVPGQNENQRRKV